MFLLDVCCCVFLYDPAFVIYYSFIHYLCSGLETIIIAIRDCVINGGYVVFVNAIVNFAQILSLDYCLYICVVYEKVHRFKNHNLSSI